MLKRSRSPVFVAAAALLLLAPLGAAAQSRDAGNDPDVPKVPARPGSSAADVGTIMYDNDTPFSRLGDDGGTVGNRFDPALNPHSVATVSFAAAGNYATSMVMTIWDIDTAAGSATVLARQLVTGIPPTPATNLRFSATVATPVVGHSGSFVAGLRNTDYDPCAGNTSLVTTCDGVALTQGTSPAPPSPSNAARIPFTSPSFVPTITQVSSTGDDIPGVNAIFRVTGDNLPVELMEFSVD